MHLDLCAELGPVLYRLTRWNHAIPVQIQFLTTLGFLATSSYQWVLADSRGEAEPEYGIRKGTNNVFFTNT